MARHVYRTDHDALWSLWEQRHPNPSGLPAAHPLRAGSPLELAPPDHHAPLNAKLVAAALPGIRWIPSPNYSPNRDGHNPNWTAADPTTWIVCHTQVGWMASTISAFQSVARQASATYLVGLDGSIVQMVQETDGPWTNGDYLAVPGDNMDSLTIEFEDGGAYDSPRPDALYKTGAQLMANIASRRKIPLVHRGVGGGVLRHKECNGASTACPDSLDIDRLIREAAIYLAGGDPYAVNPNPVPTPDSGEDEVMVYIGATHPKAASLRVYVAGSAYRERYAGSGATRALAAGVTVNVTGFSFSDHPVQSPDLGGGVAGPDYLWWKSDAGDWVPDAILDTSALAGAPPAAIPAGEAMKSLFVLRDEFVAGGAGAPGPAGPAGPPGPQGPAGPMPTTITIPGPLTGKAS